MFKANVKTYTLQIKEECGKGILLQFAAVTDKDAGVIVRAFLKRCTMVTKDQVELKKSEPLHKIVLND